jgi:hypothetical protein
MTADPRMPLATMQFLPQSIWWHAARLRFPHAPPLPPLPGHTHVGGGYNGRSARRHALCSDAKIGRWCVVVGAAQILARSAFLASARAGHSATGNLISVAAASAVTAKGSAALTGCVGLTAIGAVKTAPRAGVVFRARLIAVTGRAAGKSRRDYPRSHDAGPVDISNPPSGEMRR